MSNRREFLTDVGKAAAGVFFVGCSLFDSTAHAQQPDGSRKRREISLGGRRIRTVDIHCHCYVHDVWEHIKDREEAKPLKTVLETVDGRNLTLANLSYRLQQMDAEGIDIQAFGVGTTYLYPWAERDLAREIMKLQNEKIAELCAAHSDRMVGLAAVALQHPDLAAEQLEYAIKKLGMHGVLISANVNGEELAAAKFAPFWAKAEELGVFVFIHPTGVPEADRRFQGNGRLSNVIGNPLDTTVALSHMIFEGTLDRYPGLKICAAHGGGFLGSYTGRSDHCFDFDPACKSIKKRPSEYLKQLYFDSMVYTPESLRHLVAEVGADRILLGTDFPYAMGDTDAVNQILAVPGLSDAQKEAILGGTAAKLLRLRS